MVIPEEIIDVAVLDAGFQAVLKLKPAMLIHDHLHIAAVPKNPAVEHSVDALHK